MKRYNGSRIIARVWNRKKERERDICNNETTSITRAWERRMEFWVSSSGCVNACAPFPTAFNHPLYRRDGGRLIPLPGKLIVFCANWVYKWKSIRFRPCREKTKKFISASPSSFLLISLAMNLTNKRSNMELDNA